LLSLTTSILTLLIISWTLYQLIIILTGKLISADGDGSDLGLDYLPKISLIVPVKNEELVISRCLDSLIGQDYPRDKFEMIIVDGSSTDGTRKICEEYVEKSNHLIKFIDQKGLGGKPSALNDGLKEVTGEIVGVFDSDNVPDSSVLNRVAKKFENQDISALQCRTLSINEDENYLSRLAAKEERLWLHTMKHRDRLGLFVTLTGSCQFIRRSLLEELGGWKEDALAEDMELALRITDEDKIIRYDEKTRSWQESPSTLRNLLKQRIRWYTGCMENLVSFGRILKNPGKKSFDAEIVLLGPLLMALSPISFLLSLLEISLGNRLISLIPYASVILTILSLALVGSLLALIEKPFNIKNMAWIPIIYLYWFLQSLIALWSFISLLLGRPRVWSKTEKKGIITRKPGRVEE
jgi:cellulose synthase/poly-beta-1,6-N-acetylglucosamine synthase-like glycosyltransferase